MKFADVNSLPDQQVIVQRHERPVLIAESLRVFGARLVFDAARIAADHNRAVLFNQPFRGLDGDARRIVRRYLRVVAAGLAPVAQRPGADQYDIARLELRLLLLQSLFEVGGRDLIIARQRVEALRPGDVYQHAPRDDRRNGRGVGFARPPIAAPLLFSEAVVPVVVVAIGGVAQPVNLRGHVVVDEESRAMPRGLAIVIIDDVRDVALPLDAFGSAERDNLAGAVTGPFVRRAVVEHA